MTDTGVSSGYRYGAQSGLEQMPGDMVEQARLYSMNLDILRTVNPWMFDNPAAAESLASSGIAPDLLASRGAEIYAMQNMDGFAESLARMDPIAQRAAFGQLTDAQQRALRSMGYQEPQRDDGPFLGGALGPLSEGIGFAWKGVSNVGGAVLGPTLDGLEWLGDQPAHLYRTIRTMDSEYQWLALAGAVGAVALTGGAALGAAGALGLGTIGSAGAVGFTALGGATAAAAVFGRDQWWDAFQATRDGERVFTVGAQQRARQLLGSDQYITLAKQVAMELGEDIDLMDLATEIAGERGAGSMNQMTRAIERIAAEMADPGTAEYATVFNGLNTLVMAEPFRQAVDALNNGKISFGRDIAGLAGLDPGDRYYNLVSGSMDAAWLFGMDPFLGAGAARRAMRIRKYGLPKGDPGKAIEYITALSNNNHKIRAVHEQIAMAVRSGRPDLMPKASRGMWLDLHEYARQAGKVDDTGRVRDFQREDFLQWIADGDGLRSILSGQGTVRGIERPVLSTVSASRGWGRFVAEAKGMIDALDDEALERRVRDIAKKHGVEMDLDSIRASRQLEQPIGERAMVPVDDIDERAAGNLGYTIGRAIAWMPGAETTGKFLGSISAMAPAGDAVALVGRGAEEDMRRWIDSMGRTFGLPKQMRDEWLSAVLVQGNTNQRLNVMQAYLDSLMTATGLKASEAGREIADQFLYLHRHRYALGGADEIIVDGRRMVRGWLPETHSATHLLLPNLVEMQKLVRRDDMLRHVLGIVDNNLIEAGMNRVWKPAILLRLGFIPRAAGEEMLAWFARATNGGIVQELGARELARFKAYTEARKALDAGKVLTGKGAEAATWDLPAFARPLHFMLARRGFKTPVEEAIDTWRLTSTRFFEDGMASGAYRGVIDAIPENLRPLLLGREHSWRRLALGGVDPQLKRAADAWVLRHSDAVMAGTSAMTHSLFQTEIVNPDRQVQIVADASAPGGVRAEDIITMKGQRQTIYKQDPAYDAAAHHRITEPFYDQIIGPVLERVYANHFPAEFSTLQRTQARDAILGAKAIRTRAGKQLARTLLTPRDDVTRAIGLTFDDMGLPEIGKMLRGMALTDEPVTLDRLQMGLLNLRNAQDLTDAQQMKVAKVAEQLIEELEGMRAFTLVEVSDAERGWLVGATALELSRDGDYYRADELEAWATDATEMVGKRPERVFYRGVKNDDTFQIDPETGDLLLIPQTNSDWGGNAVSLSIFPDQSLGYAVSPSGFNSGAKMDAGLMIEVDGDFVIGMHGTTWDDVSAQPKPYPESRDIKMIDQYGEGVHLVGHPPGSEVRGRYLTEEDMGEVAIVRAHKMGGMTSPEVNAWDQARVRLRAAEALGEPTEDLARQLQEAEEALSLINYTAYDELYIEDAQIRDRIGLLENELDDLRRQMETVDDPDELMQLGTHESELEELIFQGQNAMSRNLDERIRLAAAAEPDPIRIPKGKWRIQTGEDMERIAQAIRSGEIDSRWDWLGDVKFRAGRLIEDVQRDLVAMITRQNATKLTKLDNQWVVGKLDVAADDVQAAIRSLADELEALPVDEYEALMELTGFRIPRNQEIGLQIGALDLDGTETFALELLENADRYTRTMENTLKYRNAGGFQFEQPVWTPFTSTTDELDRKLRNELTAHMMRGENSEWMRQSQRAGISGNVQVADQVPDGMERIFLPAVGAQPEVVKAMDRALELGLEPSVVDEFGEQIINPEFIEAVVDDLLGQGHAYRMHTDFVKGLEDGPLRNSLARAVEQFVTEGRNAHVLDGMGGGITLPMHGAGFSDPRIAQWVGDVLTGGLEPNSTKALGYVDIPRGIHKRTGGIRWGANYGPAGTAYEFDDFLDASIRSVDASQMVQLPDGSWAPGAAWTKGIEDHATTATDIIAQLHRGQRQEVYRLRDDVAGRVFTHDRPGIMDPIEPGSTFTKRTDLYDADGNPIEWGDLNYFDRDMTSAGDDGMFWEVIGPILADRAFERSGFALDVPREYVGLRPQPGIYDQEELAVQSVRMTHSRVDDIAKVKGRLPDATITEVPKPVKDNLWDKIVRWGFNKAIGPAINSLVRRPMSFHYFAAAYKENMSYMRWFLDADVMSAVDRTFQTEIAMLGKSMDVTDQMLYDVRLINQKFYGDTGDIDVDTARRWIGSHSGSQTDWEMLADDAHVAALAEGKKDVADAWARMRSIDQGPFRLASLAADDATTNTELFVLSYRSLIPADVRRKGPKAVNQYIGVNQLGLPRVNEARLNTLNAAIDNWDHVFDMVEETATIRALENVIPFIDDHAERSQFATTARNFFPFWYAEELFLKRWARTLEIAPEAIRKGQLLYMGMRSAGIVQTDPNGQDWVVYPGSGALNAGMRKLPFVPDSLPVSTMFRASTDSLLPGLNENMGAPQLGPLTALPVDALTSMFPEMVTARRALLGDVGATGGLGRHPLESSMSQLVPASIRRFWRAFTADENSAVQYANAMSYAMANMLAENPGLLDRATPEDLEDFLDRARNHARIIMVGQAITGFIVPGAPVAMNTSIDASIGSFQWMTGIGVENPDMLISDTYRRYIKASGIDEGTRRFLNDFPYAGLENITAEGALAYTVATSTSRSGAPLPATRTGMAWYEQNQNWVDELSYAGAWMIPHDSDDAEFDFYSYSQQITYGLRQRQAPREFLNNMVYRTAAGPYFDARDKYEQMKAEIPSEAREAHQYLDAEWDRWSTNYLGTHPVFADELVSGAARERRRKTIEQMRYAVNDPLAPESPHMTAIKELVEGYDRYTVLRKQLQQSRSQRYVQAGQALKAQFEDWVGQWILRNPELERLWSSVYRPESGL